MAIRADRKRLSGTFGFHHLVYLPLSYSEKNVRVSKIL